MTLPSNATSYAIMGLALCVMNGTLLLCLKKFNVEVKETNLWQYCGAFTSSLVLLVQGFIHYKHNCLVSFCNEMDKEK